MRTTEGLELEEHANISSNQFKYGRDDVMLLLNKNLKAMHLSGNNYTNPGHLYT